MDSTNRKEVHSKGISIAPKAGEARNKGVWRRRRKKEGKRKEEERRKRRKRGRGRSEATRITLKLCY